jgi:ATP-binding cassette subfamily B protein
MDLEREQDASPKIELEVSMIGDIRFENVSFRYGTRKQVFDKLNLIIKKGETTAIVGESGSGKTTLAALIQHLYDIQQGAVFIGDYNLVQVSNKSLRKQVGSVPQQVELFAGNIVENIAFGDLNPDMKQVVELCKQLGMNNFIEKLPEAYLTYIGENGTSLSGGEKQRIAIARALYKNPEILIFDEATSSLDSHSEKYVRQTLAKLASEGKTIIIIAHRLSTAKHADTILVMENGQVVESGGHSLLLQHNGVYKKLWNEQFSAVNP